MRLRVAALCFALALGACGKQHGASPGSASNTPPNKSLAPPRPNAAVPAPAPAPQAAAKTARPNQDGSETMEESTGDNGAHNALYAAVASTVAAATPSASADVPAAPAWAEGVNYTRIVPGQPTDVAAGQVEVLEFFWYACPHCNALDPQVEAYRKSKPAYVSFSRVPVTWTDGHRSLARLYYTLQTLGKLDQLHSEVFKEIHTNGDQLVAPDASNTDQSERIQAAWAQKEGIPESDFHKAYHSFPVDQAVIKADELVQRYRVDGVPTFVINGKYITDVRTAGSPERLMALVGDLAAQEHKR
jgi:protein dithiol oxidoreductase (disulfide-forming)